MTAPVTNERDPNTHRRREQGTAYRVPRSAPENSAEQRLRRLERLAWILDRSIPVGNARIGLDPIIGLLPGLGDWIGAMLSVYVLYEGARLGAPTPILLRMTGNILIEAIIGAVPVAGDFFDFVWQANARNMALIRRHHDGKWKPRSLRGVWIAVLAVALLVLSLVVGLSYLVIRAIMSLDWFKT
jgi:hypothetical protein